MKTITTPSDNTAVVLDAGFARSCGKCGATGIYWRQVLTANGYMPVQDVCFPCEGAGYIGKVYATVAAFDKARATAEKARERRAAKLQEEIESGREEPVITAQEEVSTWNYLDAAIGDKVQVRGTIVTAVSIDTDFGTSRLIVIETEEKQAVKLFTSAEWSFGVNREEEILVEGTVKGFVEYEGQAQTVLNRPKKLS